MRKNQSAAKDAPRKPTPSSNFVALQAREEVEYMDKNLGGCETMNVEDIRQGLLAMNDEEFYKIYGQQQHLGDERPRYCLKANILLWGFNLG